MRRGVAVSPIAQTGHSDDSHSPEESALIQLWKEKRGEASSGLMIIRASDPPIKSRRFGFLGCGAVVRSFSLILIGVPHLSADIETRDRRPVDR